MFRVVGAVVAAYAGYKYGDDVVKLLQKRNQKARITAAAAAAARKSLQIDVDTEEDDQFHYTDEIFNGDSDESTSLRKSRHSFAKERRRSHDTEVNDIPLYERGGVKGDNVEHLGFRRSRSGNVSEKAYTLDIPIHPSSRKRDSLQENEGESVVKEAVHVPAEDSQELRNVEPIKKWRRLSLEGEEKVPSELLRGLRSRFSFEADDRDLADHFRDLRRSGGNGGNGGVLYARQNVNVPHSKTDLEGDNRRDKDQEQEQEQEVEYELCGAKDPIFESEAELKDRIRDVQLRTGGLNNAAEWSSELLTTQQLKDEDLEEIDCMSEEIYSKLHNEIVGKTEKPIEKLANKLAKMKVERTSSHVDLNSRPESTSSADQDAARNDPNFRRWTSLRTGNNGRIVFWHSLGKLYDYLTGEALVNVEALDVTRGVSLGPDVMHQLSERFFLFRDRDSNEVLSEFKGVPVKPVRHSFSYTWNASQTFNRGANGSESKFERLKVNVVAMKQPNDSSKMSFNCRISLTVDINEGKFQWHEIGDYDFNEVSAEQEELHRCTMLYMGAIPPLSHIAVMHLSGWRVDDFNLLPSSIREHVQLQDISWIGQP
ncbi:hypothetical protein MPTK1_2g21060 [Marchantia polymorpha subsp. ruderalis]|uniref:Uncharacterized protein n=1 Tax=Marchantia polymorpha TaxID=3197 RepID=A0A2R6X2V0_MARPO|nr:hypothetical protein MARPO_0040s0106 [Marchantia polymorpha]BBN03139.1 hypothetical protein Mp_2g21060 [Marchantia polymorpha subsp. ruderalis]|eukprot:PTQ40435.1 hypothetical protein MARPO_0040s0106 [Marchantia polymorpha]